MLLTNKNIELEEKNPILDNKEGFNKEAVFDKEIQPLLLQLKDKCHELGLPFLGWVIFSADANGREDGYQVGQALAMTTQHAVAQKMFLIGHMLHGEMDKQEAMLLLAELMRAFVENHPDRDEKNELEHKAEKNNPDRDENIEGLL